jgi:long-chain fatty acid transport protein
MVLPMGFLGAFGIGLEQKFSANNRLELIDAALNANVSLSSRVGLYVLSPSYSIRLPFFLSDFSLGTTYRIFFGNSYSTLERGISNTQPDDAWMSRNITKKETANFESDGDWWRNFGYSMHFHRKSIDYFFSYFPSVEMQRNVKENIRFSNTDTLNSKEFKDGFKIPKYFASGIHFRFWQNQNLSLMYEQQNFEKSFEKSRLDANTGEAVSYFAEYKITGTGLYYSTFLKRNNFGMNVWYSEKYLKDVNEYGTSLFSDMWIGRRGTLVGFALFGGYRQAKEPYWAEPFFGFKLNLTGVGNWGTSARRK